MGTCDGGKSYRYDDALLVDKLARMGKQLNLAPHTVSGKLFYGPADLEGHVGTDGRRYLLDFSRTFPPVPPTASHRLGHLFRLFRPEFVRTYPHPLCSDGFSNFLAADEADAHNATLRCAQCPPSAS